MISLIWGCLADGDRRTIVSSNWLDLGLETKFQSQV